MSAQTSMLHIRVDDDIKDQATLALTAMGLSMSDAVRLFLRRVAVDQAFPLELKVPNAETQAAMVESRKMMAKRKARFADADALLADLEKTAASKRAPLPRTSDYNKTFLKDWPRLSHSGRHDMVRLKEAIVLQAAAGAVAQHQRA